MDTDENTIKIFSQTISKFLEQYLLLIKCASKNCETEVKKAIENKELYEKFNEFKLINDNKTKLKFFADLNDNTIMYNINKCALKNCKNFINDIIEIFKSFIDKIPKTSQKYDKLNKIMKEIESFINNKRLTEKKYKLYIKKIYGLLSTFDN